MFEINTALFFFGVDYHSVLVQDQDYKDFIVNKDHWYQ